MKKSVIKRRKRVIPASQEQAAAEASAPAAEPIQSPSPPYDATERGSLNPDGSISLGLRKEQHREQRRALQLVPETVLRQNSLPPMTTAPKLTQYSVYNKYHSETPQSLDDDHRLAPIGISTLATPSDRQTSLSPASFLSPTRKRSFGETTDHTSPSESDTTTNNNNKRLSSIQTLLHPALLSGSGASGSVSQQWPVSPSRTISAENLSPQQHSYRTDSPPHCSTPWSAPSPGAYSNASSSVAAGPSAAASAHVDSLSSRRLSGNESESVRAERRAALQREAQRMRELLAANERELAELES